MLTALILENAQGTEDFTEFSRDYKNLIHERNHLSFFVFGHSLLNEGGGSSEGWGRSACRL